MQNNVLKMLAEVARNNNITLSSFINMDLGAGNNLTINTKNYTSIESSNIYLGKHATDATLFASSYFTLNNRKLVDGSKMASNMVNLAQTTYYTTMGTMRS